MAKEAFVQKLESTAKDFFIGLPPEVQKIFRDKFNTLDADGSGEVSLSELRASFKDPSFPESSYTELFSILDKNQSGGLSFVEAIPLIYGLIICRIPACDRCKSLILQERYFTCSLCSTFPETQYDLCQGCFHHGSACYIGHTNFNNVDNLEPKLAPSLGERQQQQPPPSATAQSVSPCRAVCKCCHLQHDVGGSEVFAGFPHMKQVGSEWVCAFCAVWICYACGKESWDPDGQKEGAWSAPFRCSKCSRSQTTGNWRFNVDVITKSASSSTCSACADRVARGALVILPNHIRDPPAASIEEKMTVVKFAQAINKGYEVGTAIGNIATCLMQ